VINDGAAWGSRRLVSYATPHQERPWTASAVIALHEDRDPIELLTRLLQVPVPIVADLAIPQP
jgi:hypothetical protein